MTCWISCRTSWRHLLYTRYHLENSISHYTLSLTRYAKRHLTFYILCDRKLLLVNLDTSHTIGGPLVFGGTLDVHTEFDGVAKKRRREMSITFNEKNYDHTILKPHQLWESEKTEAKLRAISLCCKWMREKICSLREIVAKKLHNLIWH